MYKSRQYKREEDERDKELEELDVTSTQVITGIVVGFAIPALHILGQLLGIVPDYLK